MEKRILIYEDDPEIAFLCKRLLSKDNYRVEVLARCENVIEDIGRIKPNFILMDLWIPEIGGEAAIKLIKANPFTRHIPVFLFSANSDIEEICEKIDADGYIKKPFDIFTLKDTIERNI